MNASTKKVVTKTNKTVFKAPFAEKKIFAGITTNGEAYIIECTLENKNHRTPDNYYFALTHEAYDIQDSFTESEGEQRAKEYLDDGESWKMAVEADRTTESKDEWIETVLNSDGWQTVLGDIKDVGQYGENETLYVSWTSCGASVETNPDNYEKLLISKEDLAVIKEADRLHFKEIKTLKGADRKLLEQVAAVFVKYPEFKNDDMGKYAHCYRENGNFNLEEN